MRKINLTSGGFYQSQSLNADAQACINWIPEIIESQQGKSRIASYQRMGLKTFATFAGETQIPQVFYQNGRRFAVGANFWEIFPNGSVLKWGALTALNGPVSIAASSNQLLICSGGKLWAFTLGNNTLTAVNMAQFNGPISLVGYSDGFFQAMQQNSDVFYVSAVLNATSWSGLDASQILYFPDNLVTMIVDHGELWLAGSKQSVGYYNSGNVNSSFIPIPGGRIEMGAYCIQGIIKADNSPCWIGSDERGALMAWRASGASPQRISTHAIENEWASYSVSNDAISYAMQDRGHTLWVIYFPSASKTWVYDFSTQLWHQWTYLDPVLGEIAHRSMSHCYCPDNNTHLVGDCNSGTVFQMSAAFMDDDGMPIKRTRVYPYVDSQGGRLFHHKLHLEIETGVGPTPPLPGTLPATAIVLQSPNTSLWTLSVSDGGVLSQTAGALGLAQTLFLNDTGGVNSWQISITNGGLISQALVAFNATYAQGLTMISDTGTKIWRLQILPGGTLQQESAGIVTRDPQVTLDWSDTQGKTWSNSYPKSFGTAGKYEKRVEWLRLGSSLKGRAYRITCSDPVPARLLDAYLEVTA